VSPVDTIALAYCECARWADDVVIDLDFKDHAQKTCSDFFVKFPGVCLGFTTEQLEQCGHDLWLTRQGHGTGFWDREDDTFGSSENRIMFNGYAERLGGFWDFYDNQTIRDEGINQ